MKKRKIETKTNLRMDEEMFHTNYFPSLCYAGTDGPVISKGNPKNFTASYTLESFDDEEAVLHVLVCNKDGSKAADVIVEYDTRDGQICNNLMIQLADQDYGRANEWVKKQRAVRRFVKSLLHRFGELNEAEYRTALKRPKLATPDVKTEKRTKHYTIDEWQTKSHYRNGGKVFVRTHTNHPHN